jgi:hypothetical protein
MIDRLLYRIRYYRYKKFYIGGLVIILLAAVFGLFTLTDGNSGEMAVEEGEKNVAVEVTNSDENTGVIAGESVVSPDGEILLQQEVITDENGNTYFTRGKVALLSNVNHNFVPERVMGNMGCDIVVMSEVNFPATTMPLTASINKLFNLSEIVAFDPGNYVGRQENLSLNNVVIENGVAKVYLVGTITEPENECDESRIANQIEATALNFGTVNSVEIYLNGERY